MRFILLQFAQDFKTTTRALHYADAEDLEVVRWDILHGTFPEWADHKGSIRDGTCQARVLNLRKSPKYDNPYVLQIRNGPGQAIGQGAVELVKAEVTLSLLLPEFDARRLSLLILVRAWKQAHFADLAVARAAAGERAQTSAPDHTPLPAAVGTAPSPTVLSQPGSPLERAGTPGRAAPSIPLPTAIASWGRPRPIRRCLPGRTGRRVRPSRRAGSDVAGRAGRRDPRGTADAPRPAS